MNMVPNFACFSFVCADCGRQHNAITKDLPQGWSHIKMACAGEPMARCPDCAGAVCQAQNDRMSDYMANMHPPQPAVPARLTLEEHTALSFLSEDEGGLTSQIAVACGLIVQGRCLPQAKNMLRRLERWGLVDKGDTRPGHYAFWTITDAGRRAVHP